MSNTRSQPVAGVDLYWLPLGAGGHFVRLNGRVFESDSSVSRCGLSTASPMSGLLGLVPSLPTPVWGRDELSTGEMWNSNSLTSWLIAKSGCVPNRSSHPTVAALQAGTRGS